MTVYRMPPLDPESTGRIPAVRRRRRALRALLALVVLLLVATVVLIEVYTDAGFSPDGTTPRSAAESRVPAAVRDGGPVLDLSGGEPRSYKMPARTVALSFDDGPDPRWTPKVLDILKAKHAPATFFVIGKNMQAHPGLVRREVAEGHAVGSHTFTHPNISATPEVDTVTRRRDRP